ncbi:MAG: hypothetical protein IPJ16_02215 [Bacteroidales bacterium]|nr:hypothetical protein [Bacteroidales bacterium]
MDWFTSFFGSNNKSNKQEPTTFVTRIDKSLPIDDAFRAWTSGNLEEMLKAANTQTNPIDRHFLLQSIVTESYKLRKDEKYRKICTEFSEKHLQEFPSLAPALKEDMGGSLPRISTFQHYATILTENEEYEKAIEVCQLAISYGLHDGTKAGFEGRISRILNHIKA